MERISEMEFIGNINFDDKLYQSCQIVVCGAGKMLPDLLNTLSQMGLLGRVVAICDNNYEFWGKKIDEIQIDSYERIIEQYLEADFIVYNRFSLEIYDQIQKHVKKVHLIR